MSMQSLYEITLLRAIGHVEGRTDASIVGDMLHRDDATADYIVENNTYTWYHAIAEYYRPRRIGEIGSRRRAGRMVILPSASIRLSACFSRTYTPNTRAKVPVPRG